MTVRKRITFLIALTGLITNIIFSIVIFIELIEQPFDILDSELREEALLIVKLKLADKDGSVINAYNLRDSNLHPYWLKIYDLSSGNLFYESDLAKIADIPREKLKDQTTVEMAVSSDNPADIEGSYRVGVFLVSVGGQTFNVQIAQPIDELYDEIKDLVISILAGLIFSCIALMFISYYIAGRILKPIDKIQSLASDISEKNLDQRIPVGVEDDEFNNLARTINKMLDSLQNSFIKQRNLLFDTSHELKTPLAAMRLTIDNFCDSNAEKEQPEVKENFQQLKEQVLRMDHLVKDLLNLSEMETLSTIDYKPVNITSIFALLCEDYNLLALSSNIRIDNKIERDLIVYGDSKRLVRAFSNIIDNAIKYNKDGGSVDITGKLQGDKVIITVANTGAGLDKASAEKVFEQFYRGEQSRATVHGGSGLGLTMVKRIIELHNGSVIFDSQLDGITTVEIKLLRVL